MILEKEVIAMARKVLYLEGEVVNLKNAKTTDSNEPYYDTSSFKKSTLKFHKIDLFMQAHKEGKAKVNGDLKEETKESETKCEL